ncbi:tRNA (N6-isopentenyl adenosine(37)-C2)-methylthiotransferase MiaB [Candidatus Symbiobacter mobilis]|uniref:tRNA-2-methylthio-N(6)-dimethylallyladenosine synthase n=1 Tax=Candidatus Symbiobacter mobilis CR TaxID=946483 RepID=U5N873_9BURK|nr:tRNA (N6-isopentenyl adenosine(37)-C2)-methylthiotransferase MiaB [Candidatus Symbiobacter mobilis]AGX86468.1 2-methylthioadenine synthetase [Candidatus Symbiobacter mobilis CR]
MSAKVFVKTYGCQMNEYDSDKILDVLRCTWGYAQAQDVEDADLIVFNTCSVREKAREKLYSELGRVRLRKKPSALIAVGGCVASMEGTAVIERMPCVNVVFGPQTLHRVGAMVQEYLRTRNPQVDVGFPGIEKFTYFPMPQVHGASAFVSIMEGCGNRCSYCVVPLTRGEEQSRPMREVLREVTCLASQGVKELTLLGQNVNAWASPLPAESGLGLDTLLEEVANVAGIERLRFLTSHPRFFVPGLVDAFGTIPKLASQLHLPVQHGSDRILAAMGRGYTVAQYIDLVQRLRAVRPGMSIGSDFIVGFPGETEEDFAQLIKLVDLVEFDNSFSFLYSPRPNTPAALLEDDTPRMVKQRRLRQLQEAITQNIERISARLVGTVQTVLVEGPSARDSAELAGRTECNRVVNFPGVPSLVGQMVPVRITETRTYSLRGECLQTFHRC